MPISTNFSMKTFMKYLPKCLKNKNKPVHNKMYRILGGSEVWREPSYLLTPPNLQFGFTTDKM